MWLSTRFLKAYVWTAILIPLIGIGVSILLSPWFNIWSNAFSDLGRVGSSAAAPIFNLGLLTGGFMLAGLGLPFNTHYSKDTRIFLLILGYTLMLIGLYDESYGPLHFEVSAAFFITLMAYLFYTGWVKRSWVRPLIAVSQLTVWIIHFAYRLPPGDALPELYSILTFIPYIIVDTTS